MNQERIKKIIGDKLYHISVLSDKVGNGFEKDLIHDFRVEVKRLRSFLRLLRTHPDEPKLKMTRRFKKLYSIAGDIRDAQLELEKLSNEKIALPAYKSALLVKIGLLKNDWRKAYSIQVLHKMHARLTSADVRSIHPHLLEAFVEDKLNSVKKLSATKSPSDEQVHDARKQIKDILYTSKLAKREWKTAYKKTKKTKKTPVNQLDFIADVIGNFNDERLMLDHINSFSSKNISSTEEKNLQGLCDEEAGRLLEEKQEILSIIKEFSNNGKLNGSG